jgi:thymidylate synthase
MHDIPVLHVAGASLAQAWESSLLELWTNGTNVATQYDVEGDPPSKDCTMMIVVQDPLSEPMIHKDMPGGLADLQEYVMEVCDGIKDRWVRDPKDPNDKRWEYTYHNRLFDYVTPGFLGFDQIESICKQLYDCLYTRRAQAITWKVWEDNACYDPPCLQSIWCRILPGDELYLNMNVRFRSRDAYKAAFMNMFALVHLQKKIAARISELIKREVKLGRYVDFSDSYHIYGKNLKEFEGRFMKAMQERSFQQRTMRYCDVRDMMDEAIPDIMRKVADVSARTV